MRYESVSILGVPVDSVTDEDVLLFISDHVSSRRAVHIATINAEYVMQARRSPAFMRSIHKAKLRTADGMGVVWAARRRGSKIRRRVGGSDLVWSVAQQAEMLNHRLFLLGAAEGVAERAAAALSRRHPNLIIAGTHSGSPRPEDDESQIELIHRAHPDILMVAFGSPHQDLWIARMMDPLEVPVSLGVGGSFDYLAGTAKRAPLWMQNNGLDWLWRLVREPWRWRRMTVLPLFAILAFSSKE